MPYRIPGRLLLLALTSLLVCIASLPVAAQFPATNTNISAQKVLDFGLVPPPEPIVPAGMTISRNPQEGSRGVLGLRDDRAPVTSQSYPWSAIGRLTSPVSSEFVSICSGSLVAPDIVLTNAHCIIDASTGEVKEGTVFQPNLIYGRSQDSANVIDQIYGTDFQDGVGIPNPNDWAFLKLDKPLGNTFGTLSWLPLSASELVRNYANSLILVGYSGDFPPDAPGQTAGVHDGCNALGEVDGSLIHACDMRGGASGGPILALIEDDYRIVALNVAELTESVSDAETGEILDQADIVNYGVKITQIESFLQQFRS